MSTETQYKAPRQRRTSRRFGERPDKNATSELGGSGYVSFGQAIDPGEHNADLKGSKGIGIYDQMRRSDAQVRATLLALKLPLYSTKFHAYADDERVQEFLQANVMHRWRQRLTHMLTSIEFGNAVLEKVHEVKDGQVWLKKLGFRRQVTIDEYLDPETDEGAPGIKQSITTKGGGYKTVEIPGSKIVHLAIDQEGDNYRGISVLRSAYPHWYIKQNVYKVDAIGIERHAVGVPTAWEPENGVSDDDRDEVDEMLENYRAGAQAYMRFPHGWEFEISGSGDGSRYDPMPTIKHHDEMIARNILAMWLSLGTTESGSRALGESMIEFFVFVLEHFAELICETVKRDIMTDLVCWNFGDPMNYNFGLRYDDLDIGIGQWLAESLEKLTNSKIITPDQPLEDHIRSTFNLPEHDPDTARSVESKPVNEPTQARDHQHNKKRTFADGSYWRDLTPEEEFVALGEIRTKEDDAVEDVLGVLLTANREWVPVIMAQVEDAITSSIGQIQNITVPDELKASHVEAIQKINQEMFSFGREQVREELRRQESGERAQFRDDPLDEEEIDELMQVRSERVVNHVATVATASATDLALTRYRTMGEDVTRQDLEEIENEVRSLGEVAARRSAALMVSEAFSMGRDAQAQRQASQISHAQKSAILDDNTCEPCRREDGKQYQLGTRQYYSAAPPFKLCEGRGRCRCIYVYVRRDEQGN